MKFTIFHLIVFAGLIDGGLRAQSHDLTSAEDHRSAQELEEVTHDFKANTEKTEAVFRIENDFLYSDVDKLSITPPRFPSGTGIGIGGSIAKCEIMPKVDEGDKRKSFLVTVYGYGLVQITEVITEGFTSRHRLLGWFEPEALWNKLRAEVLRQSEEIRVNKAKKSRLQQLEEELEKRGKMPSDDPQKDNADDGK